VEFRVRLAGDEATFEVADSGIGIPQEDQERLFETFHRARNVGNISGTGLGLAIVRKSLDLHGGTIRFESAPGRGTRFHVAIRTGS
jgi:signal transduction histidine kinase